MALQYSVHRRGQTAGAFRASGPRSIGNQQIATYDVLADSPQQFFPPFIPSQVTESPALRDATISQSGGGFGDENGLPEVNQDLFLWRNDDGVLVGADQYSISPWLICAGKQAERDADNKFLMRVQAEFNTGSRQNLQESDLEMIPIPVAIGTYPFVIENIWGEEDRVIYKEADVGQSSPIVFRLPTGSLYSEPFRRRHPTRAIRQHQFETILEGDINTIIENRLFTTVDRAFQGDPAPGPMPPGDPPPRWMITNIDYQSVNAYAAGDPPTVIADAYIMSYTIERTSKDGGWYDRRGLIDTHYLTVANDLTTKTPYWDPETSSTVIPALIKEDGTLKANQSGDPDFLNYPVQPAGNWSFLRT